MDAAASRSWLLALALLGAAAWSRVFSVWFAQDDFRWLLRAGSEATLSTPRLLSMTLYFRGMRAAFGLDPAPYHAAQLLLHLGAALLLFAILAGRLPARLAAAAAAVFVTSPALFGAVHWISDIADVLAGALLVLAVWLITRPSAGGSAGWSALVIYALALLSKEIAVGAAPVLAILQWRQGDRTARLRAALCLAVAALAGIAASGAWQTAAGEPYHLSPGATLANLPAFVSASILGGTAWAFASDVIWSREPLVQVAGWALFAAWVLALIRARSGAAWLGFLWFVGLLGPVLLLGQHVYLYYLECALPGFMGSIAFLGAKAGARGGRWALALAAVWVVAQGVAIEARHRSRLPTVPLPTDFVLRRALIARNAIGDLRVRQETLRPRLVFLGQQPVTTSSSGIRGTAPADYRPDPWLDENVRAALSDGDAVRLMFPQVRHVVFQHWLEDGDTASAVAAYQYDGHLQLSDYASFVGVPDMDAPMTPAEHERRAQGFLSKRLFLEARRELEAALSLAPGDPTLLLNLGVLEANMGDSLAAVGLLERAVAAAPEDVEALYDLGLLQWRLGRRAAARVTFERLERAAPGTDLARSVRELLLGQAK